jgi:hypothetical protein
MTEDNGTPRRGPSIRVGGRLILTILFLWVAAAVSQPETAAAAWPWLDPDFADYGVVHASLSPTFEEGLSFIAPSQELDGSIAALGQRSAVRRLHGRSSLVRFSPGGRAKRIRTFPTTTAAIARDATGAGYGSANSRDLGNVSNASSPDRSICR